MNLDMIFQKKKPNALEKEKKLLSLELAEIKDVSDLLFEKIEKKIQHLEATAAAADRKIDELERLIRLAGSAGSFRDDSMNRQREICSLFRSGMKSGEISSVLDMPVGEVNLILGLEGIRC